MSLLHHVSISIESYNIHQVGDTLIVVDAGGGTVVGVVVDSTFSRVEYGLRTIIGPRCIYCDKAFAIRCRRSSSWQRLVLWYQVPYAALIVDQERRVDPAFSILHSGDGLKRSSLTKRKSIATKISIQGLPIKLQMLLRLGSEIFPAQMMGPWYLRSKV